MDQNGTIVDKDTKLDLSPDEIVKLYTDMLTSKRWKRACLFWGISITVSEIKTANDGIVSIMDVIMFDAQRQGRLSFYMVSAGEEGIAVGSAAALAREDVVFSQYREAGVFQQRGFTLDDFMSQLFGNSKDCGKGRNMPVHYGSRTLNMVRTECPLFCFSYGKLHPLTRFTIAHHFIAAGYSDPTGGGGGLCAQTSASTKPRISVKSGGLLLW